MFPRALVRASSILLLVVAVGASRAAAQAVVLESGPIMTAQPMAPPPPESRPNIGMIVSGAVLLGVGWVSNFIAGLPAGDDPFDSGVDHRWDSFRVTSLVPVAGPWVMLGLKPTPFDEDYWGPWLVINGLLQTTGFVLLIVGIATPSEVQRGAYVQLVPQVAPGGGGLALDGRF